MSAMEDLENWYQEKRAVGEVLDLKITGPEIGESSSPERTALAILETLQGKRETRPLDTSKL